jgi:hypothetical protein
MRAASASSHRHPTRDILIFSAAAFFVFALILEISGL